MATFNPITNGEGDIQSHNLGTFAAARSDNPALNVTQNVFTVYTTLSGGNYNIIRCFLPFDTTSLPAGAIASATLQGFRDDTIAGAMTNADTTTMEIVQSTQASTSNLVLADYLQVGSVSGGSVAYSATANNTYFTITLNTTGFGWITAGGITKLALISGRDFNNTAPTGINTISFQSGTGTNKPILTVQLVTGAFFLFHML